MQSVQFIIYILTRQLNEKKSDHTRTSSRREMERDRKIEGERPTKKNKWNEIKWKMRNKNVFGVEPFFLRVQEPLDGVQLQLQAVNITTTRSLVVLPIFFFRISFYYFLPPCVNAFLLVSNTITMNQWYFAFRCFFPCDLYFPFGFFFI